MYQNISEWLTVDYLMVYRAPPIVSHSYFHQKSSTLAYVPEDIVMHSLYAQITFVNAPMSILFSLIKIVFSFLYLV